jgi:hypothetical protein
MFGFIWHRDSGRGAWIVQPRIAHPCYIKVFGLGPRMYPVEISQMRHPAATCTYRANALYEALAQEDGRAAL